MFGNKSAIETAKAAVAKGERQSEAAAAELGKVEEAMRLLEVEICETDPTDAAAIERLITRQDGLKRRLSLFTAQVDGAKAAITTAKADLLKAEAEELKTQAVEAIEALRMAEVQIEQTVATAQLSIKAKGMELITKLQAAQAAEGALARAEGRPPSPPTSGWQSVASGYLQDAWATLERTRSTRRIHEEAATQARARA